MDAEVAPPAGGRGPILVIDDHELFGTALTAALRARGFDAHQLPLTDEDTILAAAARHEPGLVLLDLGLGVDASGRSMHGAALVPALRGQGNRVLVVTGRQDEPGTAAAIAAGAIGTRTKTGSFDELLDALVRAWAGEPVTTEPERQRWLARARRDDARHRHREHRLRRLSPAEYEVLLLLAGGARAAAIAERLDVPMAGIRTQIRAILTKLEVASQLEAVALLFAEPADPTRPRG
ncbi:MAG TPA: response regulator [Pseudonocardia sp.]|jgi:DNA-binding NarL/FixJ family response regulator